MFSQRFGKHALQLFTLWRCLFRNGKQLKSNISEMFSLNRYRTWCERERAIVEESGGNITKRFTCSNKSNLLNIDSAVTVRTFHCFTKSSKPSATLFTAAVQRRSCLYTSTHVWSCITYNIVTVYTCLQLGEPQITAAYTSSHRSLSDLNVTAWVGIKISSIIQIVGSYYMISFCTVQFSRKAKSLGRFRRKLT